MVDPVSEAARSAAQRAAEAGPASAPESRRDPALETETAAPPEETAGPPEEFAGPPEDFADERGEPEAPSAVLDEAHLGDIVGAFGTIRQRDEDGGRSWRRLLLNLLVIIGPGLIVMVGDNDAGGVSTYAQAGQNFGLTLLWTLPLLIPVLIVNQEMVVRLGAVTGVGHARLINERFGKFWGAFSVGDLFVLNFLTIATEFIGVSLALGYFGVTPYISVPLAGAGLIAMTATGSFRRWERFMFVFIFANLLLIPLIVMSHPTAGPFFKHLVVPGVRGGFDSTSVLLIIAIVGTTVAPWQLFFQQSNVVDKRITPRWINYERTDTVMGSFVTAIGAAMMMAVVAAALIGTRVEGHFRNAGTVASSLSHYVGPAAGDLFAIILLNASIIGAASVTLSTSYAFGDMFGARHSLHRGWREAKFFYGAFAGLVVLAATIVLLPGAPLGLITTGVQALAGVLLPSATVFLLLLCNDKAVLGPWVNRTWLNAVAFVIVTILLMMSLVLMTTTVFTSINVRVLALALGALLLVTYIGGAVYLFVTRGRRAEAAAGEPRQRREHWRMPPLALLERPKWSTGRLLTMYALRGYLVIAALLLLVKVIRLG
jgi:NRAMP (natural resistance-associated macrophage protein)-like metal ion transporter